MIEAQFKLPFYSGLKLETVLVDLRDSSKKTGWNLL